LIDRFQAKVPHRIVSGEDAAGLTVERALLTWQAPRNRPGTAGASESAMLEVLARSAVPFTKPDLLVEGPTQMGFGAPQVDLSEGGTLALLRLPVSLAGSSPSLPATPSLTLTLIDGARAVEQAVTPQAGGFAAAASPLFGILLLAVLGGFILNFMPCVLPVLSLKLLNAVTRSGRGTGQIRASFLATASGIVVSLVALGGIVMALKSAGMAVGWGVQFQQPIFLIVMALVVTLFAANLWGLFGIAMPRAIGDAAARAPGQGRGLSGDFATGVFATLLATPCSAPFLGTAVGFALTRGATEILAVFTALGIGLALPYLVVAVVPGLARLLPKPGAWMIVLRRILGVALVATAAWLITVLSVQTGWPMALAVAAILAAALIGLVIRRRAAPPSAARVSAGYAVMVLAVAALALPFVMNDAPRPVAAPSGAWQVAAPNGAWQPFDRVQVFNAVAQGKAVLVDVTADWCITCQANKALVLDRGVVRARIEAGEVLALRADWTRPNAAIAEYLASFGRYGIPFNVVYGPGAPSGIALPELLLTEDVLAALDKASKPAKPAAAGG
jgi:suppressor for copper-sensitivity B